MAMKEYSAFPKAPGLEPHHQMQFSIIPRTPFFGEGIRSGYCKPHRQLGLLREESPNV